MRERGREATAWLFSSFKTDFLVIFNCCSVCSCTHTRTSTEPITRRKVECRTHLIHNTKRALMSFRFCGCVCVSLSIQYTTTAIANIYTQRAQVCTRELPKREREKEEKITYTTGIGSWGAHFVSRACRADNTSLKYCSNITYEPSFAFIRSFSLCISSSIPREIRERPNAMAIQQQAKRA